MLELIWFCVRLLYELIIGFLCYSALKPVWRTLDLKWKLILCPLALFWFVDVACRVIIFWPLFQVRPSARSLTVTNLCNSLVGDMTYRGRWARSICRVLNVIQPAHCSDYMGVDDGTRP